jgi:hypothetical protein
MSASGANAGQTARVATISAQLPFGSPLLNHRPSSFRTIPSKTAAFPLTCSVP